MPAAAYKSSTEGMSMAESNAIGEDAGLKIAEEIMEIGPMAWFSQNISAFWIIATILSLVPVMWFALATYYKRVSALFYSNRVKAFIAFFRLNSPKFKNFREIRQNDNKEFDISFSIYCPFFP